jgi:hypothetical protein
VELDLGAVLLLQAGATAPEAEGDGNGPRRHPKASSLPRVGINAVEAVSEQDWVNRAQQQPQQHQQRLDLAHLKK